MLTVEEAEGRVALGAAWLDLADPDWPDKVELGHLDMRRNCRCVLGQIVQTIDNDGRLGFHTLLAIADDELPYYIPDSKRADEVRDALRHLALTPQEAVSMGFDAKDIEDLEDLGALAREMQLLQDAWTTEINNRRRNA